MCSLAPRLYSCAAPRNHEQSYNLHQRHTFFPKLRVRLLKTLVRPCGSCSLGTLGALLGAFLRERDDLRLAVNEAAVTQSRRTRGRLVIMDLGL